MTAEYVSKDILPETSIHSKGTIMKICAYVAGDKNIINPSIVCLSSIKKHNRDIDLFIFSEAQFATKEQIRLCKKYNITLVDIKDIDKKNIINNFSGFSRWSFHIFYNYLAPDFLYSKGYDFAIKLDYDMLCIDSFVMNEILPDKEQGICVYPKGRITDYVDKSNLKKLMEKFNTGEYRTANVGFIVFDLKYFNQKNISTIYKDIFSYISENKITLVGETCEQFCFGMLQGVLNSSFKQLPYTYNFRPYYEKRNMSDIKIIHYNQLSKPWEPMQEDISNITRDGYIRFNILVTYWIEYAKSLDFTENWYTDKELSPKALYNIYNKSLSKIDSNERKKLLENYIFALQKGGIINDNIVYDRFYRYAQIRMFSEISIHYELLFKENELTICIHFEHEWKQHIEFLQNTICKQIRLGMLCTPQKAEIYYPIKDINNINKVYTSAAAIIQQSYDSIASFINIYNTYTAITKHIDKEKNEAITLINRRTRAMDEKLKYIYEATVGDKKDNSNFVFDTIYKQKMWAGGTSGSGSNPAILQGYMSFLEKFIRENKITSIADIGWGDWQYMSQVNLKGVTYTGYDVASPVIETNKQKFSASNIDFVLYDGNFADIKAADLAICKDVLQHLPNKNIFCFIENLKKFKYILVANDIADNMTANADITMGQCRPLDLRLPPFNIVAEPVFIVDRKHLKKPNIMVLLIKN